MQRVFLFCFVLAIGGITLSMVIPADASVIQTAFNKIGFRDFENIWDNPTPPAGSAAGVFDAGDRLRGVLVLDKLDASNNVHYGGGDPPFPAEVTALFDVEVRHLVSNGEFTDMGGLVHDSWSILLGPPSANLGAGLLAAAPLGALGANGYVTPGTVFNPLGPLSGLIPGYPAGAPEPMLIAYQGPPNDLTAATLNTSTAAAEKAATNGALQGAYTMLLDGAIAGGAPIEWGTPGNGYWFAVVDVLDADQVADGGANTPIPIGFLGTSSFAYGLEAVPLIGALSQFPYVKLDNPELPVGSVIPAGTLIAGNLPGGGIKFDFTGGGSATPIPQGEPAYSVYHADSDDPGRLHPTPEPTTLMIWGILGACFAGVAWLRRRRK